MAKSKPDKEEQVDPTALRLIAYLQRIRQERFL